MDSSKVYKFKTTKEAKHMMVVTASMLGLVVGSLGYMCMAWVADASQTSVNEVLRRYDITEKS